MHQRLLSSRADKVIDHLDEVGTEFIVDFALPDIGSNEAGDSNPGEPKYSSNINPQS